MNKVLSLALGSALLLASCNTPRPAETNPLQFSAGTFNMQGNATPGTALLLRLMPGGAQPTENVQITIAGPAGWNNGAPRTVTYSANAPIYWSLGTTAALSGTYTATAQVGGKTYTATATVDAASRLDTPGNVMVAGSANQSFTVSWQAVNGAALYLGRVLRVIDNAPDEVVPGTSVYTTNTSVTLPESALAFDTRYGADVLAFNTPVNPSSAGSAVFTKQFNASMGAIPQVFYRTP